MFCFHFIPAIKHLICIVFIILLCSLGIELLPNEINIFLDWHTAKISVAG